MPKSRFERELERLKKDGWVYDNNFIVNGKSLQVVRKNYGKLIAFRTIEQKKNKEMIDYE